jgi:hypothetical protein
MENMVEKEVSMDTLIPYEVLARGNDSVACQLRPLKGPLNEFGKRTLIQLDGHTRIYLAEDVEKLLGADAEG